MSKERKMRTISTVEQKLDYEGYTNQQIQEISGAGITAVFCWKKQYLEELSGKTPEGKKAFVDRHGELKTKAISPCCLAHS